MFSFLNNFFPQPAKLTQSEVLMVLESYTPQLVAQYFQSLASIECFIFGEKFEYAVVDTLDSTPLNFRALEKNINSGKKIFKDVKLVLTDENEEVYRVVNKNGITTVNGIHKIDFCGEKLDGFDIESLLNGSLMMAVHNIRKGLNIVLNHEKKHCQGSPKCDFSKFNYKPLTQEYAKTSIDIFEFRTSSQKEVEFISNLVNSIGSNAELYDTTLKDIVDHSNFGTDYARAAIVGCLLVVSEAIRASLKHILFSKLPLNQIHFSEVEYESYLTAQIFMKKIKSYKEYDTSSMLKEIFQCIQDDKIFNPSTGSQEFSSSLKCYTEAMKLHYETLPGPWIITLALQTLLNDEQRHQFNTHLNNLYKEFEKQIRYSSKHSDLIDEEEFHFFPSSLEIALDSLYKPEYQQLDNAS